MAPWGLPKGAKAEQEVFHCRNGLMTGTYCAGPGGSGQRIVWVRTLRPMRRARREQATRAASEEVARFYFARTVRVKPRYASCADAPALRVLIITDRPCARTPRICSATGSGRPRRFATTATGILSLDDGFTLSQQILR